MAIGRWSRPRVVHIGLPRRVEYTSVHKFPFLEFSPLITDIHCHAPVPQFFADQSEGHRGARPYQPSIAHDSGGLRRRNPARQNHGRKRDRPAGGKDHLYLVASPSPIKSRPAVKEPADLIPWPWIGLSGAQFWNAKGNQALCPQSPRADAPHPAGADLRRRDEYS